MKYYTCGLMDITCHFSSVCWLFFFPESLLGARNDLEVQEGMTSGMCILQVKMVIAL